MKENFIDRLERKYRRFGIPDLMRYVVAIELIGAIIGVLSPAIYYNFLSLNFNAILHGQVWRLVTFIFYPEIQGFSVVDILIFGIMVYLYYSIGMTLERMWGTFRFTLYYISGVVFSIIGALVLYMFTGLPVWPAGFEYINMSLFLAFATLFPNEVFLLYGIIPVKVKWLGIIDIVLLLVSVVMQIMSFTVLGFAGALAIIISMLNFIIFFATSKNTKRFSRSERKRKTEFRRNVNNITPMYRHRCAICGRTERDNPELEFRYCSKCEGNYEYCSDHIYTHEHVKNSQ